MSKIAVIVDSSSYIPEDLKNAYGIYEIPVPILFDGKIKYDTDWKSPAKFYADMNKAKTAPTTSQSSPADMNDMFERVEKDGYDEAIMITLSSGISGFYQTAVNMANQYEGNLKVTVWDSLITVIAAGQQALLAAEMATQNKSMDEILAKLEILRSSTRVYLVVDDIQHLKRTGRLSGGMAIVAGVLSIKPILTFTQEGKIEAVGKERKMNRAFNWIQNKLTEYLAETKTPTRIIVADANNEEVAQEWVDATREKYPDMPIDRGVIGALIGVHTGEKAVGYVMLADWKELATN
ncbi:MAG: DegV family protein [Lactobacillaceae bacterium]|jgi:DegV family protein with EDD domain|nr:DegV family protein [Lactobacillaceae bacterium]